MTLRWVQLAAAGLVLAATAVHAQTPAPAPGPGPGPLVPGTGAGYHDPRSAFKPLEDRDGVVSWSLLSSVTAKTEKNKVVPIFPANVQALNDKPVKVQGFMLPLEPGEKQKHFLLSAVPTTCSFCVPAGPEGLIEIRANTPVKYTLDAITVQGRMAVLKDDKYGLFYRLIDAQPVP